MNTLRRTNPVSSWLRFLLLTTALAWFSIGTVQSGETTRISTHSNNGEVFGGISTDVSISGDGQIIAFSSEASDLVDSDTNNRPDIFVHDRSTGLTTLVSVSSAGVQSTGSSRFPSISKDGRFIAYNSSAPNLVANDTNDVFDIFVFDRELSVTTRISNDSLGSQSIGGDSFRPSVNADGRYIAFHSRATNLVQGDTNNERDVFLHDQDTRETTRVNVSTLGEQATVGDSRFASISDDGQTIAFQSQAANFVDGDTNGAYDIFVRDLVLGETNRISVDSNGIESSTSSSRFPSISGDGRYVAYQSSADFVADDTNALQDVFVSDRMTGETTRVSVDSNGAQSLLGDSSFPKLSQNGRYVTFSSTASDLVSDDTNGVSDVFVHDTLTGEVSRISVASSGEQAINGASVLPDISADGQIITFESAATNLVSNDSNALVDAFVVDSGFTDAVVDTDTDSDGIPDSVDQDSDNDGILDAIEVGIDPSNPTDSDNDGIVDSLDSDSDNDGLSDLAETQGAAADANLDGRIVGFIDIDGNGVDDSLDAVPVVLNDSDNDGLFDHLDLDADGDGTTDATENGFADADADGIVDTLADTDGDSIPDSVDADLTGGSDADLDGIDDRADSSFVADSTDTDGDGIVDASDPDRDGNGLVDDLPTSGSTDPTEGNSNTGMELSTGDELAENQEPQNDDGGSGSGSGSGGGALDLFLMLLLLTWSLLYKSRVRPIDAT